METQGLRSSHRKRKASAPIESDDEANSAQNADSLENILDDISIPEGIDPEYLASLPPEIRIEIINEHETQKALLLTIQGNQNPSTSKNQPSIENSSDSIDPEYLACLPKEGNEVVKDHQVQKALLKSSSEKPSNEVGPYHATTSTAQNISDTQVDDQDVVFLKSIPGELNEEVRQEWKRSRSSSQIIQEKIHFVKIKHKDHEETPSTSAKHISSKFNKNHVTNEESIHDVNPNNDEESVVEEKCDIEKRSNEVPDLDESIQIQVQVSEPGRTQYAASNGQEKKETTQKGHEEIENEIPTTNNIAPCISTSSASSEIASTSKSTPETEAHPETRTSILEIALEKVFPTQNENQQPPKKKRVFKWTVEKAELKQKVKELTEEKEALEKANLHLKEDYEKKLESNTRKLQLEIVKERMKCDKEKVKVLENEIELERCKTKLEEAHDFCKDLIKSQNEKVKEFFDTRAMKNDSSDEPECSQNGQSRPKRKKRKKCVAKII